MLSYNLTIRLMKKLILFLMLSVYSMINLYAQCAMCKESVENSVAENGQDYGAGLNGGILWLMIFPYILIFSVGGLLYYRNKKKKAELSGIVLPIQGEKS
ncbi:MAG: hypothetical protein GY827_06115 [Cytophagales bacterium]|nr:hypothetical protein [Cytophagales bacterium]